jgi:hypothetical protein
VSDLFTLYDLFAVGLGLELGGAALISRGVVSNPRDLFLSSLSFYDSHRFVAVSAAENSLDTVTGVAGLGIGFLTQLVGYVVYLANGGHASFGSDRALVAGLCGVAAIVLWWLVGNVVRHFRLKPLLAGMARQTLGGRVLDHPRADYLVLWGRAAGWAAEPRENARTYLERVFGLTESCLPVTGSDAFAPLSDFALESWPAVHE